MARPKIARTLESAQPHDLVHIDGKGRVRSPSRLLALNGIYWGILLSLVTAEGYLGYQLLGAPGLSIGVALGAMVGWVGRGHLLLRRASREALAGRLDEAEAAANRLAHGRLIPRRLRASARGWLAYCASMRGDAEGTLAHAREAVRLWGKRGHVLAKIARYAEVYALTRVGQLDEASDRFAELGPLPDADYLRVTHVQAELYLALKRGRHDLDDDALHERAKHALSITSAGPLLALLAWAFDQEGDAEMAELLFDEAMDRHPGDALSKRLPELQRWMDERAARGERDGAASPRARVELDDEPEEQELDGARARRARA